MSRKPKVRTRRTRTLEIIQGLRAGTDDAVLAAKYGVTSQYLSLLRREEGIGAKRARPRRRVSRKHQMPPLANVVIPPVPPVGSVSVAASTAASNMAFMAPPALPAATPVPALVPAPTVLLEPRPTLWQRIRSLFAPA